MSATTIWEDGLLYGLALTSAVFSTVISYYATCKYADVNSNLRARGSSATSASQQPAQSPSNAGQAQAQTQSKSRSKSRSQSHAQAQSEPGARTRGRSCEALSHLCAMDRCTLAKITVTLFVSLALEIFALGVLPLIIIAPLSMLFFVYAAIYSVAQRCLVNAPVDKRFLVIAFFIVIFTGLALYSGTDAQSALEVLDVQEKAAMTQRTIVYAVCFVIIIVSIYMLQRSRAAMQVCCRSVGVDIVDLNTVLKGSLAGTVRGQTVLLIKLFAEQLEAVLKSDQQDPSDPLVYILPALGVTFLVFHLVCFHKTFSSLREMNVELIMPVYRSSYIASTLIGASVFLQEFNLLHIQSTTVYAISMTSLLFICVILCFIATSHYYIGEIDQDSLSDFPLDDRVDGEGTEAANITELTLMDDLESGQRQASSLTFSSPESLGKLDSLSDSQRNRAGTVAATRHHHQGSSWGDKEGAGGLWNLNLGHPEEIFSLAKSRTSFHHGLNNLRARSKSAPWLVKGTPKNRAKSKEFTDPLVELITRRDTSGLDYEYPESTSTMVVKQGRRNPHAEGTNSTWVDPGDQKAGWKIRGYDYLNDRKKIASEETRMFVAAIDWVHSPKEPARFMGQVEGGYVQTHQAGRTDRPFMFVINFMVPSVGNYVNYFVKKPGIEDATFEKMLIEFIQAPNDQFRNDRFKLIPGVLEGAYIVRKSIGNKPALIGNKLTLNYHRGDNYFEVSIDVGSSKIAKSVMGAVKGFASTLVLHMGYLLESKTNEELPERVLGGVDLYRPVMAPKKGAIPMLSKALTQVDLDTKVYDDSSDDEGYETA